MSAEIFEDDGTLACLHLPADAANKRFFCREERQENLIGKTFWLQGFFADVQTRYGIRHIYKATYEKEDNDSAAFKVFTGASACKYVLETLEKMGKYPRKVTLKKKVKTIIILNNKGCK